MTPSKSNHAALTLCMEHGFMVSLDQTAMLIPHLKIYLVTAEAMTRLFQKRKKLSPEEIARRQRQRKISIAFWSLFAIACLAFLFWLSRQP